MGRARKFLVEHSLILIITVMMVIELIGVNKTGSGSDPRNFFIECFGATFGAWILLFFPKWFKERGKRPPSETEDAGTA